MNFKSMDITLIYILMSCLIVSLLGFLGVIFMRIRQDVLDKMLYYLISLSAGVLMGATFLHILPEAVESSKDAQYVFVPVLVAFGTFFLIEKILHWHHCSEGMDHKHTIGFMNLFGNGIHNFIDGVLIAGAFMIDINLGIVTAFSVALHEIPHEIGDYAVLIYSGFSKIRALFMNFGVGLFMVIGGISGYILSRESAVILRYILPFAGGGFIYIAASDLVPELKKEQNLWRSLKLIGTFGVGIIIIYLFGLLEGH